MADEITNLIFRERGLLEARRNIDALAASAQVSDAKIKQLQATLASTGASAAALQQQAQATAQLSRQIDLRAVREARLAQAVARNTSSTREAVSGNSRLVDSLRSIGLAAQAARGNIRGVTLEVSALSRAGVLGGIGVGGGVGIAAGIASAFAIAGDLAIARGAEQTINLQRRVSLFTDSQEEAADSVRELFDVARRTRTEIGSLTESYEGAARAARDLGLSQRDVLQLTESIAQSVRISGGSTQSAQAAIVQLSQALSSGELRGQELRSVLEQAPRLAQAIAEGLSQIRDTPVGTGDLLRLGASGQLRAGEVAASIRAQSVNLAIENESLGQTPSESLRNLRTSFVELVGTIDKLTGSSERWSEIISNVSLGMEVASDYINNNLDEIKQFITQGGRIAGQSIRANPMLPDAVGLAVERSTRFRPGNPQDTQRSQLIIAYEQAIRDSQDINRLEKQLEQVRRDASLLGEDIDIDIRIDEFEKAASLADQAVGAAQSLENSIGKVKELSQGLNLPESFVGGLELIAQGKGVDFFAKIADDLSGVASNLKSIEALQESFSDLDRRGFTANLQRGILQSGGTVQDAGVAAQNEQAIGKIVERLKEAGATQEFINQQTSAYAERLREVQAIESEVQSLAESSRFTENLDQNIAFAERRLELEVDLRGASEARRAEAELLYEIERDAALRGIELTEAQIKKIKELAKIREQLRVEDKYKAEVESNARAFAEATVDFTRDLSRGFDDAGDAALRLLDRIGQLILEITLFGPLTQALTSAFSPGGGFNIAGLFTPSPSAHGNVFGPNGMVPMASGGIYSRPTFLPMARGGVAMIGEAGEEAVMPLGRDRQGRLGVRSGDSGGGASRVVVMPDSELDRALASGSLDKAIAKRIASPGSELNRAVRAAR